MAKQSALIAERNRLQSQGIYRSRVVDVPSELSKLGFVKPGRKSKNRNKIKAFEAYTQVKNQVLSQPMPKSSGHHSSRRHNEQAEKNPLESNRASP